MVFPYKNIFSINVPVIISDKITEIDEVYGIIPGESVQIEKVVSKNFSSTGEKDVFQKAKKYNTPPVTLWVVWKNTGPLRVAVLCSRKVDKRAVVRNKVKRRIREALRAIGKVHALHAEIIVSAKSTAKTVPTSEFKEIILHVLNLS